MAVISTLYCKELSRVEKSSISMCTYWIDAIHLQVVFCACPEALEVSPRCLPSLEDGSRIPSATSQRAWK